MGSGCYYIKAAAYIMGSSLTKVKTMIIVEGCDNSGKSTLVQKLAQDLKLLMLNNRKRPESFEESYIYTLTMCQLASSFSMIFDRWQPISEPIYGPICRNTHIYNEEQLSRLHAITQVTQPLIIYCRPDTQTILNFGERDQMAGVVQHGKELIQAYDDYLTNLSKFFHVVQYDYERQLYDDILKQALVHLKGPIQ